MLRVCNGITVGIKLYNVGVIIVSSIYDRLVSELAKGKGLSSSDRNSVISALDKLENSKLNIMLVGAILYL